MKKLIIILMLVSSEAFAVVNYCIVNKEWKEECKIAGQEASWSNQRASFNYCCYDKETYEEFLKVKSE